MCKNGFFYIIIRAVANMSEWYSAEEKLTKCQVFGEGMSGENTSAAETLSHSWKLNSHLANMSEWWNGRHVRFRCVWRNLCGFKSHLRQVKKSNIGYSFFYVDWSQSNDTWQLCHLTQITPHPSLPRVGEGINLIFVSPHHTPSVGVGINPNRRLP